jgi:hypothetical protein
MILLLFINSDNFDCCLIYFRMLFCVVRMDVGAVLFCFVLQYTKYVTICYALVSVRYFLLYLHAPFVCMSIRCSLVECHMIMGVYVTISYVYYVCVRVLVCLCECRYLS